MQSRHLRGTLNSRLHEHRFIWHERLLGLIALSTKRHRRGKSCAEEAKQLYKNILSNPSRRGDENWPSYAKSAKVTWASEKAACRLTSLATLRQSSTI